VTGRRGKVKGRKSGKWKWNREEDKVRECCEIKVGEKMVEKC